MNSTITAARWRPTVAHFRAMAGAVALIAIGLIWHRPDLLVMASPLACIIAWSLATRPSRTPELTVGLGNTIIREGDATTWRASLTDAPGADLMVAVIEDGPWFERRPQHGVATTRVTDGCADIGIDIRSTRWGIRPIERARVIVASPWASFRWAVITPHQSLVTLPVPAIFDARATARPTDGLIGLHRSARRGEGNEYAGVRAFQAGDRLRRINWVRSMRTPELQVNATLADLDVHVALVLDVTEDFGVSEGIDGRASSLDATVRAAGAIAEHYAPRGERVSMRAFGTANWLVVPPATGRAQLRRVLDTLARVQPVDASRSKFRIPARSPRGVTGSQMTVMLSPLIAPDALDHAVSLGRQGLSVIVVDTLPADLADDPDPYTAIAWRIRLLERRRELRLVRSAGIPIVQWQGPGSLDQVIRDISRRRAAPRVVAR